MKLDQQIWRLPHFAGHVVRGERLNPWFPLDKRHSATKIVPEWPIAELFT